VSVASKIVIAQKATHKTRSKRGNGAFAVCQCATGSMFREGPSANKKPLGSFLVSGPGESHPEALAELYVSLFPKHGTKFRELGIPWVGFHRSQRVQH